MIRRISTLILLATVAARADIGPKPREYAPGLEVRGDLAGLNVEMSAEEVSLTLKATGEERHEKLIVDAVFHMKNLGDAVELEEGFPVGPINNMSKFTIEIDGTAIKPELADLAPKKKDVPPEDAEHNYWYLWKAKFPAKAASKHVVHYEIDLHHRFYTTVDTSYILHTGAPWKNAIGRAKVTFKLDGLPAARVWNVSPLQAMRREGDVWIWDFKDLEPTIDSDIRIRYDCEDAWEDEVAGTRPVAEKFLGMKFRLCKRLLEVPSRQGRATMTDAELKDACDAFRACLDGASGKNGAWTVPIQPSGKYPTTSYDWGEFLYEEFPSLVALAEAHPKSDAARDVVRTWLPIADAMAGDKLSTGKEPAQVQDYIKKAWGAKFDAARERAKKLAGGK